MSQIFRQLFFGGVAFFRADRFRRSAYSPDYVVLKAGLRLAKLALDRNTWKSGTGRHCSKSRETEDGRQAGGLLLAST
ncbi:MAG: hypothetical protein LBT50_10870 [Prevotellaceae bacterium]|jgi:hypothetical protein|nr:hypothetical protein [Prevotellaceae bacterium]